MSLKLQDIDFRYGLRKALFRDFRAEIRQGTITALLGPNGTGKTTLLKLCCGLLVPDKGSIQVSGFKVSSRSEKAFEQLFFVPDTISLPAVTALRYGRISKPFYKNFDQDLYETLLERLEVPKDQKLTGLSFGQQKKAYLALAFAACTPYLFLDEPTNGLDPQSMESLKRIIAESAHETRSIIISTHHLKDVENLCDDFMILDNDHALSHGNINEIMRKYHFGTAVSVPDDSIYHEETFGQFHYISPRSSGDEESRFNLSLYMNAVLSKKIIS